jgi:hypothetical protein
MIHGETVDLKAAPMCVLGAKPMQHFVQELAALACVRIERADLPNSLVLGQIRPVLKLR